MQYSSLIRKKDNGYQYVITYKNEEGKWKTKSKQGFTLNKAGKELAKDECDKMISSLCEQLINEVKIDKSLKDITFLKFSEMYLKHIKLYRAVNTVRAYKYASEKFCDLNDIEISKITSVDMQTIVDKLTLEGLNPNTIQDYIRKIATIFKFAMDDYNLISALPTRRLNYVKLKSNESRKKRALNSSEEEELLWDFKFRHRYYLIILIALKCGLRVGEIMGLTWNDIDTKKRIINVNKQWKMLDDGSYDFGELKTKNSYRDVPIPINIINEFEKYKKVTNINNRVFKYKSTLSIAAMINKKLRKYDITIHELRHTYATTLIANGLDFKTAADLLGHDVRETYKTYSHVTDDMKKRASDLIDKIL